MHWAGDGLAIWQRVRVVVPSGDEELSSFGSEVIEPLFK